MNANIAVLDDDTSLLQVMEYHISEAGFPVHCFDTPKEALSAQKENPANIIFTDINLPQMNGIDFIREVRTFDTEVVIIVITGYPSVDIAVEAMKAGAFDFIQKPVEEGQLLSILKKAVTFADLSSENRRLKAIVSNQFQFGNMISHSASMQELYKQAQQVANSTITTLISGETGTGKEVLAKAIHLNSSRKEKNFVAINCAAVPSTLIESELFGHLKGAFTGAVTPRKGLLLEAHGGTFFMDEIGDLPLELQPKLLRVLQEKEFAPIGSNTPQKVDIRFICATHRNLEEMVAAGEFREDLYFRLNVITLTIPPLRERRDDILPLFKHFLKEASEQEKRDMPHIETDVVEALESHEWSGNVRELQNVAYRCAVLVLGDSITVESLPFTTQPQQNRTLSTPTAPFDLEEHIDHIILSALKQNNWNQSQTARFLNVSRNTLIYRLKRPLIAKALEAHKKEL